jgi:hypothetical protein
MAPFNCSIKTGHSPTFGHVVNPGKSIHAVMTDVILKAIGVMRTPRARGALAELAERWSEFHQRQINTNAVITKFQGVLATANHDHSKWPTMVMDWTMTERKDAVYHHVPAAMTTNSPNYPVEAEYIALNGVVSFSFTVFFWEVFTLLESSLNP